jgi:hypothetical protein
VYRFKRPDELDEQTRGMITDFDLIERETKDGKVTQRFKYKTVGRKDALDSLARTHGMFRDRVEHEHTHRVKELFEFVARHPERGDMVARLARQQGRVIDAKVENRDRDENEREAPLALR